MSGSEQLRVATAIVRKLNPDCGFVLIDKLEQMDIETMNEFGTWLEPVSYTHLLPSPVDSVLKNLIVVLLSRLIA